MSVSTRFLWGMCLFLPILMNAQTEDLPRGLSPAEKLALQNRNFQAPSVVADPINGVFTEAPEGPIRSMAEWEELEAIVVTWTNGGFGKFELSEIIRHAQEECRVIVVCNNAGLVSDLLTNNYSVTLGPNVEFLEADHNSIWVRDYGPNSIYQDEVDSLMLVDWIYNRTFRPQDDTLALAISEYIGLPLYTTTQSPNDLVNTGGNFMSDGLGTGFSSELVLEENEPGNPFNVSAKDKAQVDQVMQDFMGISPYINMEILPYDGIHHIDMHMKLLDERRILVAQFPEGVSDGPQIEANIQYVLSNFQSAFDEPYEIIRIPQPPCGNGSYPPNCSFSAEYRTYTNALIVNKTILVPIYGVPMDQEALAIWEAVKPGYKIVGINCTNIINAGGAIHCITKEVGVKNPLRIVHQPIDTACGGETPLVSALLQHRTGLAAAKVWYSLSGEPTDFTAIDMTAQANDLWQAELPPLPKDTQLYYYIEAQANSGKTLNRPMPAPAGYWTLPVGPCEITGTQQQELPLRFSLQPPYPNPAQAITAIPVEVNRTTSLRLQLVDALGQVRATLFEGSLPAGKKPFFIQADQYPPGVYFLILEGAGARSVQKLVIQ